jgi:hypothetical protein
VLQAVWGTWRLGLDSLTPFDFVLVSFGIRSFPCYSKISLMIMNITRSSTHIQCISCVF